jgi:hypothetical protein
MKTYNNHDKLRLKKILGILKLLQETCCTENTSDEKNDNNKLISKLPIIIAEKTFGIPIESKFKLKTPALAIKNMKKDVYLTNSTLLPMYEGHDTYSHSKGKLFLEGFVRNKLDFSIAKSSKGNIINLDTESVIIYIPFKCTTLIQYNVPPVLSKLKNLDPIPLYISPNCADNNNEYIKCNIPPINCELKGYKINETYTLLDKTPFNEDFPIEINFNAIKENIVINISITLLQEQDVAINLEYNTK